MISHNNYSDQSKLPVLEMIMRFVKTVKKQLNLVIWTTFLVVSNKVVGKDSFCYCVNNSKNTDFKPFLSNTLFPTAQF